jgi:hypothetical protein
VIRVTDRLPPDLPLPAVLIARPLSQEDALALLRNGALLSATLSPTLRQRLERLGVPPAQAAADPENDRLVVVWETPTSLKFALLSLA